MLVVTYAAPALHVEVCLVSDTYRIQH